jgi:hypothetical protein
MVAKAHTSNAEPLSCNHLWFLDLTFPEQPSRRTKRNQIGDHALTQKGFGRTGAGNYQQHLTQAAAREQTESDTQAQKETYMNPQARGMDTRSCVPRGKKQ